jgi:cytochrome P450
VASVNAAVESFKTDILEETRQEAVACPFGYYKKLREESPIAHVRFGGDDVFILTRRNDICDVLRRADIFSNRRAAGPKANAIAEAVKQAIQAYPEVARLIEKLGEPAAPVLDLADPPHHTRQRALIGDRLMPQNIRPLEEMLTGYVDHLIDGFIADGKVELVEQFSVKLPLHVITAILGIPEDMQATFRRWTDDQVSVIGNPTLTVEDGRRVAETNVQFHHYFTELIKQRRIKPGSDLISEIVARNDAQEHPLGIDELIGIFHQLSGAGHETTRNLITASVYRLASDPELFAMLKADPALVPSFIEEMLRLETPTISLFRNAVQETHIGSTAIPQGSLVLMLYAAGNRDPEFYDNPDELDLSRRNLRAHLSFGQGRHACVGSALAKMEPKVAITRILARLSRLAVKDGFKIEYGRSYMLRGISELQLTFATD